MLLTSSLGVSVAAEPLLVTFRNTRLWLADGFTTPTHYVSLSRHVFLKFEFQDDRSINVGAVGVEICLFPLTRLIAYTTAGCYRTSCDQYHITLFACS